VGGCATCSLRNACAKYVVIQVLLFHVGNAVAKFMLFLTGNGRSSEAVLHICKYVRFEPLYSVCPRKPFKHDFGLPPGFMFKGGFATWSASQVKVSCRSTAKSNFNFKHLATRLCMWHPVLQFTVRCAIAYHVNLRVIIGRKGAHLALATGVTTPHDRPLSRSNGRATQATCAWDRCCGSACWENSRLEV
jgi:hypothetical protein